MKQSLQNNIPKHVAIIMDGNGRWAKKIGKKRAFGHENGTSSVRECINASISTWSKKFNTICVFN
jgi:undecaprenyl diphosphate synthase